MNTLKWNDKTMSIGITLMDEQHKELLNIINQLNTSIYNNTQNEDIFTILNKLIDYAGFHFITEEELFSNLNYDDKEKHKNEHKEFLNKFIKLKDQFSNDEYYLKHLEIEISEDIVMYLIDWFLNHIIGSDKKYAKIFIEQF